MKYVNYLKQFCPSKYPFDQVQDDYSGNNYGHQETRDAQLTTGEYFVLLSDGRTQKVAYTVDGYGG